MNAYPPGRAMRAAFPIFGRIDPPFHFLDSAATGQICQAAADALLDFETGSRANVKRGVYRLADQATQAFEAARRSMADYVGVSDPREIVLTHGATAGLNIAANGLADRLREGDNIVLSTLEHHSNIVPWQLAAQSRGADIRALPVTDDGRIDLDAMEDLIDERTRIVTATHISNVTGAKTDLGRLSGAAHAVGAVMVVDGAQRAAHGPIDMASIGADLYAFSSHKMFGPTGAGVLWGRFDLLDRMPPFAGGGEMIREVLIERSSYADVPHRFEAGTPPIGPILGMAAAARFLIAQDAQALAGHELRLTERLLAGLGQIADIRVLGPQGLQDRAGIVTFDSETVHAHDICQMLDRYGVCLRGGHHCAQPLMERFDTPATVRASLAPYNDDDDIDALLSGLVKTMERLG